MQAIVNNLLTSYEKVGKGPVILMLHGWGDNSATFKVITEALKSKYSLILVDLPGFGRTAAPKDNWGLNEYCDFVAEFLNNINEKNIYAVIGHSNGGAIAIRGLANSIWQTNKLVLLASSGIRDNYKGRRKAQRAAAKAAKLMVAPLPKRLKSKIKKRAYKAIGSDMFVAEHMQETFKKVVTDDVLEDAQKLNIPTLLVYGANDTATPKEYGELFHVAIKGSDLKIVDETGHFLHHENPDLINKYLIEFLGGK